MTYKCPQCGMTAQQPGECPMCKVQMVAAPEVAEPAEGQEPKAPAQPATENPAPSA